MGRCCCRRASLGDKGPCCTQGDKLALWGPLLGQGLSQDHSSPAGRGTGRAVWGGAAQQKHPTSIVARSGRTTGTVSPRAGVLACLPITAPRVSGLLHKHTFSRKLAFLSACGRRAWCFVSKSHTAHSRSVLFLVFPLSLTHTCFHLKPRCAAQWSDLHAPAST